MPLSTTRLQGFNRELFHPGQRVCCALSGGADSTALLLALLEANGEKEALGVVLSAVHVHHGLRGSEADTDQSFVQDLCAQHNLPLAVVSVDTRLRQQDHGEGVEEAARELRYSAFRQLLSDNRADVVATAHTLDDQAETVVLKLLRGAWTEGLAGIAPELFLAADTSQGNLNPATAQRPFAILRPLLAACRAEVERYLRERNQPWREDSSNRDLSLTRNRVRHELMPLLRTFNPAVDAALARTADIARDEEAFWKAEVARVLPGLVLPGKPVRGGGRAVSTAVGERTLSIEIDRLKSQSPALRARLLRAAAATLGCRPAAEDTQKLLALAGLARVPGLASRNGTRLDMGNGLRAERSLRELRFGRVTAAAIPKKM